jgi:hypothetical protein
VYRIFFHRPATGPPWRLLEWTGTITLTASGDERSGRGTYVYKGKSDLGQHEIVFDRSTRNLNFAGKNTGRPANGLTQFGSDRRTSIPPLPLATAHGGLLIVSSQMLRGPHDLVVLRGLRPQRMLFRPESHTTFTHMQV